MLKRNLPPLDLLVPFESAARHGSFTRAADELSVTQSAVSQRVRTLEAFLETALFVRKHRSIELTDEGQELFNGAKIALQHLSAATQSIRRQDERPLIKFAVDTSIASLWLTPRLKTFLRTHPKFAVDLTVSDDEAEILDADIIIMHGDGKWPGYVTRRLFFDDIFPVCSAAYLDNHPIRNVSDLLNAELIDLDYKCWNWMNWAIWLTEANVDPSDAAILIRTNSYTTQIEAARAGMGVALGWRHLLDDDLSEGTLVQPIPDSVETCYGYFVLLRQGVGENAHALAKHLFQQSGVTGQVSDQSRRVGGSRS